MINRYKKILFEAEKGTTYEVSEGKNGELIIRVSSIPTADVSIENYANPPIPDGYIHVEGEWNNGFVIERCSDGSQFTWIPVGILDFDGTLDGKKFSVKFGRRDYHNVDKFSDDEFHESITKEIFEQIDSVNKYGGFYLSSYLISKSSEGKPQSVKGAIPWVNINFDDSERIAASMEDNEAVKSHLTFGAEYDSALAWFIMSEATTLDEIEENYLNKWDNFNGKNLENELYETGSCEGECFNNIYDFGGNVDEWTQEENGDSCYTIRGVYYYNTPHKPVVGRLSYPRDSWHCRLGFRVALRIE